MTGDAVWAGEPGRRGLRTFLVAHLGGASGDVRHLADGVMWPDGACSIRWRQTDIGPSGTDAETLSWESVPAARRDADRLFGAGAIQWAWDEGPGRLTAERNRWARELADARDEWATVAGRLDSALSLVASVVDDRDGILSILEEISPDVAAAWVSRYGCESEDDSPG